MDKILNTYFDELTNAMTLLSKNEKVIFLGQSVEYPGHALYNTIKHIPIEKRIEMPVAEELQMGISIGMALQGFIPVTLYPRFDFIICAMNQLVNHLDNMKHFGFNPKVIIRVAIGSTNPMDPGIQHKKDHAEAFKNMLKEINIIELKQKNQILEAYRAALNSNVSTLIIEHSNLYND